MARLGCPDCGGDNWLHRVVQVVAETIAMPHGPDCAGDNWLQRMVQIVAETIGYTTWSRLWQTQIATPHDPDCGRDK